MLHNLALPEIRELIDAEDYDTLGEVLHDWLAADVAAILNRLEPRARRIFGLLGTHQAAEAFEYLDVGFQQDLLASLDDTAAAAVLNDMSPDDRTASSKSFRTRPRRACCRYCRPSNSRSPARC